MLPGFISVGVLETRVCVYASGSAMQEHLKNDLSSILVEFIENIIQSLLHVFEILFSSNIAASSKLCSMIPPLPHIQWKFVTSSCFPLCCFYLSSGNYYTLPHFLTVTFYSTQWKSNSVMGSYVSYLGWVLIPTPLSAFREDSKMSFYRMSSLIVYWLPLFSLKTYS